MNPPSMSPRSWNY